MLVITNLSYNLFAMLMRIHLFTGIIVLGWLRVALTQMQTLVPHEISAILADFTPSGDNPSSLPAPSPPPRNIDPSEVSAASNQTFTDMTIDHDIPSHFTLYEVFTISGVVNQTQLNIYKARQHSRNRQSYLVTVVFAPVDNGQKMLFTEELPYSKREFKIQCYLERSGKYFLGMFIGESGIVQPKIYEIQSQIYITLNIEKQPPEAPQNMSLDVTNNDLYVRWVKKYPLTKIKFSQQEPKFVEKAFLVSNDQGYFKIPYAAFKNFSKSRTTIEISYAECSEISAFYRTSEFSPVLMKEIDVTEHHFIEIKKENIEISGQLPSMLDVNSLIEIRGRTKVELSQLAIVIEPDHQIVQEPIIKEEANISSSFYKPYENFTFEQIALKEGTYIIEINHAKGYAVINMPVYVGEKFPLLPDYHDLSPEFIDVSELNKDIPKSLEGKREFILEKINEKRIQFGIHPVVLDFRLNLLAQRHSDEMARFNYASHSNLQGQSSGDRARKMKIYTPIGENIAVNPDIQYALYRLARSPIHLKNIINPHWEYVGIGVSMGTNYMYYITEEYTTRSASQQLSFTDEQLNDLKNQFLEGLDRKSSQPFQQNIDLSKELEIWHDQVGFEGTNALKAVLNKVGILKATILITTVPYTLEFVSILEKEGYLKDRGRYHVGVSVRVNQGLMEIVAAFY